VTGPAFRVLSGRDREQLPRLRLFRAAHPRLVIEMIGDRGAWQARMPEEEDGETVLTRWHLVDLLDRLAELLGEPTQADAEIVRLYHGSGMSIRAVADKTGYSARQIRNVVLRARVMRSRLRRVITDVLAADVIRACTSGGMTRQAAADALEVPVKTIDRILKQQLTPPDENGDLQRPGDAATLADATVAYLAALARVGKLRTVRRTAHGHRWYYRSDIEALARRRRRRKRR
jgi:hypothetical protein